jgi:uncharacterized phage protein (TIGR02218 family)
MSYNAAEASADAGAPIDLYTWTLAERTWRFTNAARDVQVETVEYTAAVLSREGVEDGPELRRAVLRVIAPRNFPIAELYRISPPSEPITVILQQVHAGSTDTATLWTGRVVDVEWRGAAAQISMEPLFTSIKRNGLRRKHGKGCHHVLYSGECGVNPLAFRETTTVGAVIGNTLSIATAALQPSGYFSGGFLEYSLPGGRTERRFITAHADDLVTLMTPPAGLVASQEVQIYPGCDRILDTCAGKFSNALNYGGFPYFPPKNPFGGSPMW